MRINKFLIVFFISIFAFTKIPQAYQVPLVITYKQGMYDMSELSGYTGTAKLITPNTFSTLTVFDSNGSQKFYARFNNVNSIPATMGPIEKGDIAVIIGTGELSISYFK